MNKIKVQKLPLTSDYVFKRIFGQEDSKSALIDFLESILKIKIQKIQINNAELPKEFYDSKLSILDLKVTLNDNMIINVEMQLQNEGNIEQRSTFYMSSTYALQLGERNDYTKCKKVVVINILNFNYYKRNTYHSIARMKFEEYTKEEYVNMGYTKEDKIASRYIEMHTIELPKFKKKNPGIEDKLEQWLWLFIGKEEKIMEASKINKEIERINIKLASMSLSREERNNYESRLKAIRDTTSARNYAERKGIEKGLKEGKEKGVKEEKIETAKRLLLKKVDIDIIREATKLSNDEINKLKE